MKTFFAVFLSYYFILRSRAFLTGNSHIVEDARNDLIPHSYIIVNKPSLTDAAFEKHLAWVDNIHSDSTGGFHGKKRDYSFSTFKGYAGEFSPETLSKLKASPDVAYVSQDAIVRATACKSEALKTLEDDGMWNLGRISHRDNTPPSTPAIGWDDYIYDDNFYCKDTHCYLYTVDTGIDTSHPEFAHGRAKTGYVAESEWNDADECGHGTHVTGSVIGKTYGSAKKCRAIAVKVLGEDCSGTWAGVISGISFSVTDAEKKKVLLTSVVNMSLGGYFNQAVNDAVSTATRAGMTVIVAAGNSGGSSCTLSPASADSAIAVGATNITDGITDWSSTGCCVSLFAPGDDVLSAWPGNQVMTLSGTSMASPQVAGTILYLKCLLGPKATPAEELQRVLDLATDGDLVGGLCANEDRWMCKIADGVRQTCAPNKLVFNGGCTGGSYGFN